MAGKAGSAAGRGGALRDGAARQKGGGVWWVAACRSECASQNPGGSMNVQKGTFARIG